MWLRKSKAQATPNSARNRCRGQTYLRQRAQCSSPERLLCVPSRAWRSGSRECKRRLACTSALRSRYIERLLVTVRTAAFANGREGFSVLVGPATAEVRERLLAAARLDIDQVRLSSCLPVDCQTQNSVDGCAQDKSVCNEIFARPSTSARRCYQEKLRAATKRDTVLQKASRKWRVCRWPQEPCGKLACKVTDGLHGEVPD